MDGEKEMTMIQVGLLGVLGTLLAVQFKSGKTEYGIYMGVGISLIIFFSIIGRLEIIVEAIREISAYMNMNMSYIGTLVKMLGITYVAEFSAGICKDAGYQTIAVQIEIFSKLAILVLSMPILMTLLETIQEFLS